MSEESKSWYKMIRPLFNSGYEDDEFWAYGQDGFNEVLDSFIGSDVEIYDKSVAKTPKAVRAIIQNVTGDAQSSTLVRRFSATLVYCIAASTSKQWRMVDGKLTS